MRMYACCVLGSPQYLCMDLIKASQKDAQNWHGSSLDQVELFNKWCFEKKYVVTVSYTVYSWLGIRTQFSGQGSRDTVLGTWFLGHKGCNCGNPHHDVQPWLKYYLEYWSLCGYTTESSALSEASLESRSVHGDIRFQLHWRKSLLDLHLDATTDLQAAGTGCWVWHNSGSVFVVNVACRTDSRLTEYRLTDRGAGSSQYQTRFSLEMFD